MLIRGNHDDVSDYRYQQLFTEICDYKEIYDSIGKEKYGLVLSHYPIFSWRNMGRGKILLYGHTHESEEDKFYQNCLRQMQRKTVGMYIIRNYGHVMWVVCFLIWIIYHVL